MNARVPAVGLSLVGVALVGVAPTPPPGLLAAALVGTARSATVGVGLVVALAGVGLAALARG